MIPPEMSYAAWLAEQELRRQRNMQTVRNYYAGEQSVRLTPRQKQYLGQASGGRFVDNACREVVDAVVDRLLINGFTSSDAELATWLGELHTSLRRLSVVTAELHKRAVRDGEAFLLVTWDDRGLQLTPQHRFIDGQAGGDGNGMQAVYPDGDTSQPMRYAAKRWTGTVVNGKGQTEARPRMTLYFPERVEKYIRETSDESGWRPYQEPGDAAWPIPWVDRAGAPLGIAATHFRNPDTRSELWDAIPLQDALNKLLIDTLAGADTSGFRLLFAHGFVPTTDGKEPAADGGNLLALAPGSIISTKAADAGLEAIPPGDLGQLLAAYDRIVVRLATVTRTPISRLTGQVQAAETLKEQKEPLLAKVRVRQELFGEGWEQVLRLAVGLANAFGGQMLARTAPVEVTWLPAETRDEKAELEALALKQGMGVPEEQLWREMGYTEDEIDRMQQSDEVQARVAGRRAIGLLAEGMQESGGVGEQGNGRTGDGARNGTQQQGG